MRRFAIVWPEILARIGSPCCRNYAWRAIGSLEYAKSVNCKPETISGPRWSPDFDAHLNYCKSVQPPMRTLRGQGARPDQPGMPHRRRQDPQGNAALQVAQNNDASCLSGIGYEVNTRVIIRATDAAGVQNNITKNRSDAGGSFVASVSAADVCTVAGTITFTAEDQDKALRAGEANCPPPAPAGAGDGGSPIAAIAEAFNGTWNMRMSNGVGYRLTLEVNGDKVNGTFVSPRQAELDGTVAGSLPRTKKGRFEYTFSQPGTGLAPSAS